MKHRILVAGGAGYIGSHVQKQLLEDGFEVAVFDDLSSGDRKNILPGAAFIEGNILDKAALNAAMRQEINWRRKRCRATGSGRYGGIGRKERKG